MKLFNELLWTLSDGCKFCRLVVCFAALVSFSVFVFLFLSPRLLVTDSAQVDGVHDPRVQSAGCVGERGDCQVHHRHTDRTRESVHQLPRREQRMTAEESEQRWTMEGGHAEGGGRRDSTVDPRGIFDRERAPNLPVDDGVEEEIARREVQQEEGQQQRQQRGKGRERKKERIVGAMLNRQRSTTERTKKRTGELCINRRDKAKGGQSDCVRFSGLSVWLTRIIISCRTSTICVAEK